MTTKQDTSLSRAFGKHGSLLGSFHRREHDVRGDRGDYPHATSKESFSPLVRAGFVGLAIFAYADGAATAAHTIGKTRIDARVVD